MRNKKEILEKAKHLLEEARGEFVQSRISRRFRNCSYNECSIARNLGKFHYCRLKTSVTEENKIEKLFVCDSDEWACQCNEYDCQNEQKETEREFVEIIANPSRCGQLFPKLSALLWILNDGKHADAALSSDCQTLIPHGHEKNEENREKKAKFWNRILRVLWGG